MIRVRFTSALTRFFPDLTELEIQATTVREVILNIEKKYPGIMNYLLEDSGELRKHVNIFRGEELISDRKSLNDPLTPGEELFIFQALSGG